MYSCEMFLLIFLFFFLIFNISCEEVKLKKPITINKCCSMGKYLKVSNGMPVTCTRLGNSTFTGVVIYDKELNVITNETLKTAFDIVPAKFADSVFKDKSMDYQFFYPQFNWYLTKESGLIMETPNVYDRFLSIDSNHFCYEYIKDEHNEIVPRFWVELTVEWDTVTSENEIRGDFNTASLLVSSVFLLIVLIVYSLLPELRNLCGLILIAYVSSLLGAFVLLASIRLIGLQKSQCIPMTCAIYFFFMTTFCWMNVMSYDIWWTFRGYAKARPIHRRGEMFKFAMYSLYGYGVPLAMTIFLRVMNDVDLTHMPWIIQPGIPQMGCFIKDGQKLVYLYIPMMILILSNWLFYLMTAFNVWRLSRGTAVLDSAAAGTPAAHRSHRQRFLVYLKLSVVMGLNWVLEVVSFLVPSLNSVWWISDAYNLLIGVIIFVIFVCKPKILKKLLKLLKSQNFKKWAPHSSNKTNDSSGDNSTSQETKTTQVCADPKGPVHVKYNF